MSTQALGATTTVGPSVVAQVVILAVSGIAAWTIVGWGVAHFRDGPTEEELDGMVLNAGIAAALGGAYLAAKGLGYLR